MNGIDRRLDDHERRISATESEIHEVNLDVAALADIVLRARRRHAARLRARMRRSKRSK